MPLSSGTRLGAYEILSPLGAGGMGEVYRARDQRLGRLVAIKVLPSDVASSSDRLARFEREARTVAGLNHPNIVTLHSIEDEGDVRFLTMELVEGQTLSTLVTPGGLPVPRILELAIALTDALVAAHERGVVHRDLKPGNVMVNREGRVKVLDFGLAKMMDVQASGKDLTIDLTMPAKEGQIVGTVPYMAPEQLRGESADERSDLFALGVMLYELATGQRPFAGSSMAEIGSSILRDTPEALRRLRSDFPAELERVVERCLAKTRAERVQTALEVNNELRLLRKTLERGPAEVPRAGGAATVAVLPFVNRSASADDEYFSDGLADELLNVLAKIKGLRVSARASSFRFKGKDVPLDEIGRALNVATVLDGSVRKAGNRVRISVQLVNVNDGYHLWSETYDRTLDDIFAVQDDIARSVVKELRTALLGEEADSDASGQARAEVARAAKGRTTDPEVHRLVLLARHAYGRKTRQDTAQAIEYYEKALERDPHAALVWVELGRAYYTQGGLGWAPWSRAVDRGRQAAERALSIEPDLADAHGFMARIHMETWDWRAAEASFARALELDPSSANVLRGAGTMSWALGRWEEARTRLMRSLEQDPLSTGSHQVLGTVLRGMGRFAEAEASVRRALELAPEGVMNHAHYALLLIAMDRKDEALREAARERDDTYRLWALTIVHHALGNRAESDSMLAQLIEQYAEDSAYQIASAYAARGETDQAFDWLERAYRQQDPGLLSVRSDCVRWQSDSRWPAFLRKLGLDP